MYLIHTTYISCVQVEMVLPLVFSVHVFIYACPIVRESEREGEANCKILENDIKYTICISVNPIILMFS